MGIFLMALWGCCQTPYLVSDPDDNDFQISPVLTEPCDIPILEENNGAGLILLIKELEGRLQTCNRDKLKIRSLFEPNQGEGKNYE